MHYKNIKCITLTRCSTPVFSSLVFLLYYVARDPNVLARLQQELATVDDISNYGVLSSLPYLNSVINETLRLHPAVPTGGLRNTPPEGITIAGHYIPGNVNVAVPSYSLHRRKYSPFEFMLGLGILINEIFMF